MCLPNSVYPDTRLGPLLRSLTTGAMSKMISGQNISSGEVGELCQKDILHTDTISVKGLSREVVEYGKSNHYSWMDKCRDINSSSAKGASAARILVDAGQICRIL